MLLYLYHCIILKFTQLDRYIEQNGLHHVKAVGLTDEYAVRDYMAAADIFFLPSKFEGIAIVLYEVHMQLLYARRVHLSPHM
jgi:glycosyltransferase involved in cell wall biosynthesis